MQSSVMRGIAMVGIIVASLAWTVRGAVQVQREGDHFRITTEVYQARINSATGMLDELRIDRVLALQGMSVDLEPRPLDRVSVTQQGPDRIDVEIAARDKDQVIEKALVLTYRAEESTLTLKLRASVPGMVAGRGPRFTIGPDAEMCRSLEFKEAVPVPVLQARHPWTRVKYFYRNGATLGLLNRGAGNPFNSNENGQVSGRTYARGGYVPNADYTYQFVCARGEGHPALGSPAIEVVQASTPAVYWQGKPVEATLRLKRENYEKLLGIQDLSLQFQVQDAFEQVVSEGQVPLKLEGDLVEVKVPLGVEKLGWYRAYFSVNDPAKSLLEGQERLIFSVLRHQENMGESFDNQIQTDYTIGLGRIRLHPHDPSQVASQVAEAEKQSRGTDVMVSWQIDGPPRDVGKDPRKFGAYVGKIFEAANGGIDRIEIINEPDGNYQPREYIDTFLRPAYEAIKRVCPQARVLGPVTCGIAEQQASYLEQLYKLGLKDVTDELSFHPYAGNFDDGPAVARMRRLKQIIDANGDGDKKVHFTEAGYFHNGWSNLASMREIIKLAISQYVWQNVVMGIDHRHNFYYFTDEMGYLPMWLRSRQLTPAAVALRQYTSLVKDQQQPVQLDFGSLQAVRGFVYPGKNRQVVILWTSGNRIPLGAPDPVTSIRLRTDASQVQRQDCFGNPIEVRVIDGALDLEVGTYPSYLILPAEATVQSVPQNWGTNVALSSLGAIAEASTEEGTRPAVSSIDGDAASETSWRSATPNEFPQTLTISLSGPAMIDRIGLWSYSARGYDIEILGADGQWKQVLSRRDQPWMRFRNEPIDPVLTDQVRLTVVDSHGSFAEVAELQLFSSSASDTQGAGELVNWASKENGASATASSELIKQVTVAEQNWGARQPRIKHLTLEGRAENAIDGKRNVRTWPEFFPTTWMAATDQALPQWLEVRFDQTRTLRSITVYTVAFASWKPQTSGIRDWDVQVWSDGQWETVEQVRGNQKVSHTTRLRTPRSSDRIRILVTGTNDEEGAVGIMEVEAYGPKGESQP